MLDNMEEYEKYNSILNDYMIYFKQGEYTKENEKLLQAHFKFFVDLNAVHLDKETFITITKMRPERVKICKECDRIFYSVDRMNRKQVCNSEEYIRYSKEGKPFKNNNRKSVCEIKQNNRYMREYRKKKGI